ncbi:MAG TPA: DUF6600 domain-containing protein [Thermoanaerobaculia bacterium]|nr:DUF6600 domain-containing protein [Thermoanaerobaculia bacterium]
MKRTLPGILSTATVALAALLTAVPAQAQAQGRDEYGDIQQTVARISYFDGQVSFARGDDPDDWQPADRNVPMTLGDRVYTGNRSRIELQVHGGDVIRLGAQSDLAALNLTDDTRQFSMRAGVASFHVRDVSDNQVWEVDTPNAAVTFEARGDYRIDVDGNGDTRVFVRRGSANVAAGGGQIPVDQGQGIQIYGTDQPQYDYVRVAAGDGWDQWVDQRESRFANAKSYRYISADIVGADDLDENGRWEQVPQYGWAWTPTVVAADWAPYRVGHWIWQDPWGWTWVSAEPWGWAPYHYGRWVVVSSRWFWIPVAPAVRYVRYSPALVAFTGGGPGFSVSITSGGGGFVGWFPLGPRDPFNPWWGSRVVHTTTVTNVTYVNRTYVTVVNQSAFVSGTPVSSAWVRDRAVVTQVESAPVIRGTIPVMPTAGALRVAVNTEARTAPRPPAAIVSRPVVVRAAPPPAPPTFQAKIGVITRNGGAPVEPAAAARISVENRGRPQTVTEVRPVAAEPGRVTLAPKNAEAGDRRRPEPVTAAPARGRPIATQQQPVAAQPVTGGENPSGPPSREVVPRQPAQTQEEQPPQPQPRGNERRRVEPAQPQQEPQVAPQVTPRGFERRRVEPPSAQPQQPQEIQQQQPRGQERRRVEPAPTPQQQPQQPEVQQQPRGQERRRVEPAPQQQVPPPQPPQGYERQRRQEPTPKPDNPQGQQRGRQAGPPPQQQQQQPTPQQQRQQPPPQQQQQPQGENRQQVQRGRQANPPEGQQNKEKGNEKKDEKKQERGRPTPKPD